MSRQDNIVIHIDADKHRHHDDIVPMALITGSWKDHFTPDECKVMIAEALNDCVYHHRMKIAGYLITDLRLCLILKIDPDRVDEMLQHFYKSLRKEIYHRLQLRERILEDMEDLSTSEKHSRLFVKHSLHNYVLIRLLTGRRVQPPYYSPYIERMKIKINHERFCSAVDYTGAKGPVLVKVLKAEEFRDVE